MVGGNRSIRERRTRSEAASPSMNDHDYNSLLSSLNDAVEILHRNRTPDPRFIAAFDTLKQARAMIEATVSQGRRLPAPFPYELVAA